ncbi:hypothetical protein AYR62_03180 [Secundilactobacillus paracollinoides]|uniref:Lipocalin-like domain-containing protein n=1 Tax=Secundilactobacillus paracollinoides TaxID=240427 RepID=A0A1B2J208_9LACO|nr:hypothetical protein [Secundilactobacillus paracollinoides]ANZ62369.1 hypothetical protein AYR61_14195 [Secundilactobacillus paracollinoides]ANZ63198.1 hypothetical protein AYR62_03180 [Secundilactobacillus paracollinoides]ANZ68320.1 hypothetical protein AYR63_15095 [Secundilactobacillus paracollinoides]
MYQLLRGTLIGVVSLGLFAVDTTTSVSASSHTSPTSLRGTWYHYFTKNDSTNGGPKFRETYTVTAHSQRVKYSGGLSFSSSLTGNKFIVSHSKAQLKLLGHGTHTLTGYYFGNTTTGDIEPNYSYHLKLAGKTRHVLMTPNQNGHLMIFTTYKPSKDYQLSYRN